ncbi:chromosomal replication initiator protein DnaA [uncultured Tyzzerella sp.]|uniref:chromosomal replication initiator protein DnaA n=1 Tax=uncultured Tyzzerella sp. TaxID=2321398 RepID=UPI0029422BBB|nr:chromosomal replication initiator protein DnaA [uncultured Tyzzerella sp.]
MNTYEDCWEECLKSMQQELGDFTFKTWFVDLQFISYENNTIILKSSDIFYIEHIKLKYMSVLTAVCEQCFNQKNLNIKLVLEEDLKQILNQPKKQKTENNLNNNYIFENFVIGESNRLAHAASVAVAESPGIYNPLFLYGDVGLGKTHLMHAIANYILSKNPDTKVLYASCEKFTNELIASIREQKNKEFREKYRKIDVLLIDDIQFIVDKTQTQEEFFHTFNDLKDSGKQIIISSDRPPNEIETLTERLRSRFAGGLIADIKTPNFETRTAILEKKAESLNISIPKDVSQFIAKSVKSNIRELEGALTRVIAYSNLTGVNLSVELAENALKDIIQDKDISLSTDTILEAVSNHFNVKIDEIRSKKRNQPITIARQVYMYLTREILNESLLNIGRSIGRDHSTVIHGIEKIEEKLKSDKNFENSIIVLRDKILKK